MLIKEFDMLSPPITLYFQGKRKHHSIFSGILTILSYIAILAAGIYYILEFVNRQNPTAYFFNRYIEDAGEFPVNASSMFHFIQIMEIENNRAAPFDFQAFRIVGFDEVMADTYNLDDDISTPKQRTPTEFNHWLYGPCNNNTDTQGIGYLINFDYFENSACIRKYYDKKAGKYYETTDPNFKWPVILKGCSHPDRTYYGIIMERCRNDEAQKLSGFSECKSEEEINNIINKHSVTLYLIDHYADALNYEMPFKKYFYAVTTALTSNNFAVNHLNFNPATMITHNGLFFDNKVQTPSYFFRQNEKQIMLTDEQSNVNIYDCLIGFYFWMQNSLQYYERIYKRLQDVLSNIGGISSIVISIAEIINFIFKNYIILLDTEDLVLKTHQNMSTKRNSKKLPTILEKANEIMSPPRRVYNQYSSYNAQQSSNYQRLMKDGIEIYQNNNLNNNINEYNTSLNKRRRLQNNNINNNINIYERNNQLTNRELQRINSNNSKGKYNLRIQNELKNKSLNTNNKELIYENSKDKNEDNPPIEKQNFSFIEYIKYVMCLKKNNPKMLYYEDFRNEIISEENLLQNYIDIYQLLKICKIDEKTSLIKRIKFE